MTKIGIIGSGEVGVRLANGLSDLGYSVTVGSNTKKSIEGWQGKVATFEQVAELNDNLILAVKGSSAEAVVKSLSGKLANKIIIDTTNPIEGPPTEGVLNYFTELDLSLMERLSKVAPKAKFAKALNSVGNNVMFKPDYNGVKATMFICGEDQAKKFTNEILTKIGWEVEDLGGYRSARLIEPLCALWCVIGFNGGGWNHAFKLLKAN